MTPSRAAADPLSQPARATNRTEGTLTLTLLGTGAAERVPHPTCLCPTCLEARRDTRFRRRHSKALVTAGRTRVLIDCGRDFRPGRHGLIDGVLLTHFHFDHVLGLSRLGWVIDSFDRVPLLHPAPEPLWSSRAIVQMLNGADYLAARVPPAFRPVRIGELSVSPLPLSHGVPCYGYLLEAYGQRIAYLTDTRGLPAETRDFLVERRLEVALVDCTFAFDNGRHDDHNDLGLALQTLENLAPSAGVLTHISHRNWPYSALAEYSTAGSNRWVVGLDGLSAQARDGIVSFSHPAEGRLVFSPRHETRADV